MKKLLSMVVAFAMVLTLLNMTAFAANSDALVIFANSQEVKPGETATIQLTVNANPGFAWLSITPVCSEGFSWQAANGELPLDIDKGAKNINWSADVDCTETGVLVKLTITVAANVAPGDYVITFRVNECYNEGFDDVNVTIASATIKVSCPHTNTTETPEALADCDSIGYTAGVYCNDCKTYISGHEEIPATNNHVDADGKWEHDENGHFHTCGCGAKFEEAAHTGGKATCTKKAECETCGAEYGEVNKENHGETEIRDAVTETCGKPGYTGDTYCKDCGEKIATGKEIPATGAHVDADGKWEHDENGHFHTCGCGAKFEEAAHSWINATCTEPMTCAVCKVTVGNALGHNWKDGSCIEPKTCTTCGIMQEMGNHNYQALVTAPGCMSDGYTTYTCSLCGHSYRDDYVLATGHSWVSASCTEPMHCVNCGVTVGTELGHNYVDSVCTICGHQLPAVGVTVTGTVTSYLTDGDVTVELLRGGEVVHSIVVHGKTVEYNFESVMAGIYTLRVSKENHVSREHEVTVGEEDVNLDVKVCPKGDVTGDGAVNIKDFQRLLRHVNRTNPLTDYALVCGDVTGDGVCNIKDFQRLLRHVNKTNPLF